MVIRLMWVSDHRALPEFDHVFRTILGWNGDLGYIIRMYGEEFQQLPAENPIKITVRLPTTPAGIVRRSNRLLLWHGNTEDVAS